MWPGIYYVAMHSLFIRNLSWDMSLHGSQVHSSILWMWKQFWWFKIKISLNNRNRIFKAFFHYKSREQPWTIAVTLKSSRSWFELLMASEVLPLNTIWNRLLYSTCVRICFCGRKFHFPQQFFRSKKRTRRPFFTPRSKLVAYLTSFLQRYQHFWRSAFFKSLCLSPSSSFEWNVSTTISLASSWKLWNSYSMCLCHHVGISILEEDTEDSTKIMYKSIGYTVLR